MWSASLFEILLENEYVNISTEDIRRFMQNGFLWDFNEKPHHELIKDLSWWQFHEKFFTKIIISNGIPLPEAINLSKCVKEKYLTKSRWFLYEDTIPVLNQLNSEGYECYILSNHTPELNQLVDYLGLNTFIRKVYNSAYIGYEKSHTNIYRNVIANLDVPANQIIMIGDNYISDITGARSNGFNAILVRSPNAFNYGFYSKNLDGIVTLIQQCK
jgi:putative hydrolase of the HAD superfamily